MIFPNNKSIADYFDVSIKSVTRYKKSILNGYTPEKDYTEEEIATIQRFIDQNKNDNVTKRLQRQSNVAESDEKKATKYDLDVEIKETKLKREKILLNRLDNQLVDIELCTQVFTDAISKMYGIIKTRMRAIPSKLASRLIGLEAEEDIELIIRREIDAVLSELSNYDKRSVKRKCLKTNGDNAIFGTTARDDDK